MSYFPIELLEFHHFDCHEYILKSSVASEAVAKIRTTKRSQTIVVTGISGAGKTETAKYLMEYLCNSTESIEHIRKNILKSNTILEIFGNAKTCENPNSSRFCKFIEVGNSSFEN